MRNLLEIKDLKKQFSIRSGIFSRTKKAVQAVRGVSFEIGEKETLGLIGESGCGKTTLGRLVLRLVEPDSGKITFNGEEITSLQGSGLKSARQKMQMIFQDPFSSLNPRMSVGEIIAEPLVIHKRIRRADKKEKVSELLRQVGLSPNFYHRYPHEFSGGQRQRVGIARALSLLPSLVVADEPVSALDVSVASQILELLKELQHKFGLSYLFIAHDLRMVKYMSDRIAVMYLGKVVELASRADFEKPLHPYSQALVESVPVADPSTKRKKIFLVGEVPSPISPPSGCSFHPRCPYVKEECKRESPDLREWKKGHWVACHFVEEIQKL